ncbi:MAG: hypothetical protein Q8L98_07890 [Chlamydiales bacterium]|nr:hypothetical protein [Chlamydiales bacterium]
MATPISNNSAIKKVLDAGKDLVIGALTIVATVALVAKPIFATLGTPTIGTKVGAALGLSLLGGPIGWAIFGTVALVGAVYFGHKLYQTLKTPKSDDMRDETKVTQNKKTKSENAQLKQTYQSNYGQDANYTFQPPSRFQLLFKY